jgi:hypothetical protein
MDGNARDIAGANWIVRQSSVEVLVQPKSFGVAGVLQPGGGVTCARGGKWGRLRATR